MTTAIYVRVSTSAQNTAGQSSDLRNWKDVNYRAASWFEDKATGTKMDRPEMNRLMDEVRAGRIKRIVIWRLDRLGRTARGLLELCEELQALGVTLVSLREGLDLSTPAGRLLLGILASMAQFETEVRGERCRAGIAAAKARGQKWGGSKKGPRKLTEKVMRQIADMVKKDWSTRGMCAELKLSPRTLMYALKDLRRGDFHAKSTPSRQLGK